ncbi:UDP-N-acetylmuramate--L-alanine ligase [Rarobacter incanus]|uniref:UDP-N-acetylmuramate--L-alanine ligase n=1 Tax=Rarobacter incanus TaxID=153494 RepID=A0A542SLQ1_9MICO|nr:UDP-N-acetylmuramate--L-alanine ligase [Rarobacter incanus]TQK75498.1 UDP-N-acetylmuramate--L-alanine ligase [Rarobacter incanus]
MTSQPVFDRNDPRTWGTVHLIAVGGAGMSVVAQLLADLGLDVQGSDAHDSANLKSARARGIRVWVGHDPAHVQGADTVVVSSAIGDTNCELVAARAAGLPVLHRSEALAAVANPRRLIAVAGAHGKTTTTAMIAVMLRELGDDPSFAVGGSVKLASGTVSGGHSGTGESMVIEADESDGSFLNYRPAIAVINNIEPDHLDHYGSAAAFDRAFVSFAGCVRPGGLIVTNSDDPGTRRLLRTLAAPGNGTARSPRVVTVGFDQAADYRIGNVEIPGKDAVTSAIVRPRGHGPVPLELQVPGEHNVRNAAMALAVAAELGFDVNDAARALHQFIGTGRRFETRGVVGGVRVIDDYAHHPTEVAALITAASKVAAPGRVLVIFQPHLYSRTQNFADEFARALELADHALVTSVYPAREAPRTDVGGFTIVKAAGAKSRLESVDDMHAAARRAAAMARPGDVIALVGAGDITTVADEVLAALADSAGVS